jgi:hypothetical protein
MTSNLIYSIHIPRKQQISVYWSIYYVKVPKPLYDQFAAELNLKNPISK